MAARPPPLAPVRRLPRRPRRRKAAPIAGPPLIDQALRRLRILDKVRAMQALRAYALACGPRFLQRTRAERFQPESGMLTVRVESSAWANEMVFVREQILRQIQQVPGGKGVRSIRFTVGPLEGGEEWPAWVDPPRDLPPEPPPAPAPCDPRVAAALTQVPDDDLRDALGALYVRACREGRRK